VREERERFVRLLAEGQRAVDGAYFITAQRTLELATRVKLLWSSRGTADRRLLLDELLQNPVLDATTVRDDLKKPFRAIEKMARTAKVLPYLDEFGTAVIEDGACRLTELQGPSNRRERVSYERGPSCGANRPQRAPARWRSARGSRRVVV
jgi:hypothetical protein